MRKQTVGTNQIVILTLAFLAQSAVVLQAASDNPSKQAGKSPVKVFILAGQSNMQGQAVADLDGRDYNDGKGTLIALMRDPAKAAWVRHLKDDQDRWTIREDVWVRYKPENAPAKTGSLTLGFTPYEGRHHFGPELQFGHVIGDAFDSQILLIKTAWGGKSLYADFRPPSSGGTIGPYYNKMLADTREAMANLKADFPGYDGGGFELAGFVWYHGWNDGCDPQNAVPEYEQNLVNFIRDVRRDLNAPHLPFVIGELTGPWVHPTESQWIGIRKAQAAAAARPEFQGTVLFVQTHDFVRSPEESPNPGHGHHEFGNAETYFLVGNALGEGMKTLLSQSASSAPGVAVPRLVSRGLAGYVSMDVPAPPEEYGYGVSLYSTAWPLVEKPLRDFQIGLASIWIVPENRKVDYPLLPTGTVARDNWPERGPSYRDVFQTIEGGLGFWASTRFGSTTAKFRMNGTANGYNHEISSPGWGFGDTTALKPDEMGIAQLSPWLLVPPDGLTFREGTCGELFGYAWMVLPLTEAKATTAGLPIPTGNQSWTMFINSANFKGPVAFYTPVTWSRISRRHPPAVGRGLDSRPGLVTGGAIEVNTVPRFVSQDSQGNVFTRIPCLQFPADEQGRTILIHNLTHYSKDALYRSAEAWLAGSDAASGKFDEAASMTPPCKARRLSLRQGSENLPIRGFDNWVETASFDETTFGLQWKPAVLEPGSGTMRRGSFPEYCRQEGKEWQAIRADDLPDETGLKNAQFASSLTNQSYTSPESGGTCWSKPGPKAGPFQVKLSDGSVVTYSWYRFIDQPSLQDADLSDAEKNRLQAVVEKIHAHWTMDKDYMPPPKMGTLAAIDSALIVTPPKGLEVGYVPIVTRQSEQ